MRNHFLIVKDIKQTCSSCPSQWEGHTINGNKVYIRYRYGFLSVEIANEQVFGKQLADGMDGVISWEKVKEIANIKEQEEVNNRWDTASKVGLICNECENTLFHWDDDLQKYRCNYCGHSIPADLNDYLEFNR